jgi:N-acetylated-alpha-linked acidic dipeptidase
VPVLNLAALDNAVLRLKKCAHAYDAARVTAMKGELTLAPAQRVELDGLLRGLEGALRSAAGLPGREWFQHMIYAPGLQTGYGVKTLPGVREAIEERRWPEAERFAGIVGEVLGQYCDRLEKATALLAAGR